MSEKHFLIGGLLSGLNRGDMMNHVLNGLLPGWVHRQMQRQARCPPPPPSAPRVVQEPAPDPGPRREIYSDDWKRELRRRRRNRWRENVPLPEPKAVEEPWRKAVFSTHPRIVAAERGLDECAQESIPLDLSALDHELFPDLGELEEYGPMLAFAGVDGETFHPYARAHGQDSPAQRTARRNEA